MTRDDDIRALLEKGLAHYGLGDVTQAVDAWKKALALDPENARALEYLRFVNENWAPDQVRESEPYRPDEWSDPKGASLQQAGQAAEPVYGARPATDQIRSSTLPPHPPSAQGVPEPEPSAFTMPPPEPVVPESALGLVGGQEAGDAPDLTGDEVETLFEDAREMLDLDDFSGAMELLDKVLDLQPEHAEAGKLREGAAVELVKLFRSKIGDFNQVPEVRMAGDEVIWLNLDHRAGFVLSLVDGRTSYEDILSVCGLPQLEGMRILVQLLQEKVIDVS